MCKENYLPPDVAYLTGFDDDTRDNKPVLQQHFKRFKRFRKEPKEYWQRQVGVSSLVVSCVPAEVKHELHNNKTQGMLQSHTESKMRLGS